MGLVWNEAHFLLVRGSHLSIIMMKLLLPALLLLQLIYSIEFAWADQAAPGGYLFALNSDRKSPLFRIQAELTSPSPAKRLFASTYFDQNNSLALKEEAQFNNLQLETYVIIQKQLDEIYRLEVRQGKLYFSKTAQGKTETQEEDLPENLVIGPSFVPFLRSHWNELLKGETIKSRLAVLERKETIGFNFSKDSEGSLDGRNVVVIQMKPANFITSLLVKPIYFTFERENRQLIKIVGRMLPKVKDGSNWKDLEAEAVFLY